MFTPAGTVDSPELNFQDSRLIFIQEMSLECPRPWKGWSRSPCMSGAGHVSADRPAWEDSSGVCQEGRKNLMVLCRL